MSFGKQAKKYKKWISLPNTYINNQQKNNSNSLLQKQHIYSSPFYIMSVMALIRIKTKMQQQRTKRIATKVENNTNALWKIIS